MRSLAGEADPLPRDFDRVTGELRDEVAAPGILHGSERPEAGTNEYGSSSLAG